jgi:hypothetical protein
MLSGGFGGRAGYGKPSLVGQLLDKSVNPDSMADPESLAWYGEFNAKRQQRNA